MFSGAIYTCKGTRIFHGCEPPNADKHAIYETARLPWSDITTIYPCMFHKPTATCSRKEVKPLSWHRRFTRNC